MWDEVLRAWSPGVVPEHLREWAESFRGHGDGEVVFDAFPEPYVGNLGAGTPAMVMLGLNPGGADLAFQGLNGLYTRKIKRTAYSKWAATAPYTDQEWETPHGPNVYHRNRLAFARRWHNNPELQPKDLLIVELYPWHSHHVTGPIHPPNALLREWVWEPLADIGAEHVFAFGKPWLRAAQQFGLGAGRELQAPWTVPSRHAVVFTLPSDQQLVVLHQRGYAGPPAAVDTERLRTTLQP
jgi:hypothetical protein